MNIFPTENKNIGETDLQTLAKQSHNQASHDEHIIALVKFLARRAAEDDFRMYQSACQPPDKTNNGD